MFQITDLHYSYPLTDGTLTPALRGINLTIEQGCWLTLLGGNGSGKSTLAQCLNGLLIPQQGSVEVLGLNTAVEQTLPKIRSNVGYVMQNPDNQIIATSVEDDVAFGPENLGVPREQIKERISNSLAMVGLTGFERKNPVDLSGGQKQRLAIAGVLALNPQAIILDEATSMLDPQGVSEVLQVLRKLHASGITIISITHHAAEIMMAQQVVILGEGLIVGQGTPREILAQTEKLAEWNIEMPPVRKIGSLLAEKLGNAELAQAMSVEELAALLADRLVRA